MTSMKYLYGFLVVYLLLPVNSNAQTEFIQVPKILLGNELLITFNNTNAFGATNNYLEGVGLTHIKQIRDKPLYVYRLPRALAKADVKENMLYWIDRLQSVNNIKKIEPNYIWINPSSWTPNDPNYTNNDQWNLRSSHAHSIDADLAWDKAKGENTRIAVIDQGFQLVHSDINATVVKDVVDHQQWQTQWSPYELDYWYVRMAREEETSSSSSTIPSMVQADGDSVEARIRRVLRPTGDWLGRDNYFTELEGFHGTAVAGTAAASTNNGYSIAGVAPEAELVLIRAAATYLHVLQYSLDEDNYYPESTYIDSAVVYTPILSLDAYYCLLEYDDLIEAIYWAVDEGDADVINISYQLVEYPFLQSAPLYQLNDAIIYAIWDKKATVVAASGNNSSDDQPLPYPARYSTTIAVGATNAQNFVSSFSNSYPGQLDLVAPGEQVLASFLTTYTGIDTAAVSHRAPTWPDWEPERRPAHLNYQLIDSNSVPSKYTFVQSYLDGTSIAAPHVSGASAVLLSYLPTLWPEDIKLILKDSAEDTNSPSDREGDGRLNLNAAIAKVTVPDFEVWLEGMLEKSVDTNAPPGAFKHIEMTWGAYPGPVDWAWYSIEKKVNGGNWQEIDTVWDEDPREYSDWDVQYGNTYSYRIMVHNNQFLYNPYNPYDPILYGKGNIVGRSEQITIEHGTGGGGGEPEMVSEIVNKPATLTLDQNYPNPFNPDTQIKFGLPKPSHVRLRVLNIRGETVRTLVDEDKSAGWFTVNWNGENEGGHQVASGIYLYLIETDEQKIIKRMTLIR